MCLGYFCGIICGAKGNRTPDLRIANATLYQLSYSPIAFEQPSWSSCKSSIFRRYSGGVGAPNSLVVIWRMVNPEKRVWGIEEVSKRRRK